MYNACQLSLSSEYYNSVKLLCEENNTTNLLELPFHLSMFILIERILNAQKGESNTVLGAIG